ncbi:MAG: hypothetical protein ACTSWP_01605 [Candidatus Freyarchaeota archaeon]
MTRLKPGKSFYTCMILHAFHAEIGGFFTRVCPIPPEFVAVTRLKPGKSFYTCMILHASFTVLREVYG